MKIHRFARRKFSWMDFNEDGKISKPELFCGIAIGIITRFIDIPFL